MGISIRPSFVFNLVILASTFVIATRAKVFTSRISLHLNEACGLFARKVEAEDGQCNQFVLYDTIDDKDELAVKPGIDIQMIETYLSEAEDGKMCYSPDDVNVASLKDGCATLDVVCTGGNNVMYCAHMAAVTNAMTFHPRAVDKRSASASASASNSTSAESGSMSG